MANYDIDTKDIFLYERKEWGEMGDSRIYNELVSIIKPIIARNDTPIFGRSQTGPRKIALEIALAQENDYKVDNLKIFEWDGEWGGVVTENRPYAEYRIMPSNSGRTTAGRGFGAARTRHN